MKKMSLIVLGLMLVFLCSCGEKDANVLLEKTGIRYELTDNNSFYYPKDFKMDLEKEFHDNIVFVRDNEVIKYYKIVNNEDNQVTDLPLLYEGELEQNGASHVSFVEKEVDSGLLCYEYVGIYESSGMHFKHIVYFDDEATYVLSYEANKDIFSQNIDEISAYLNSLVISQ